MRFCFFISSFLEKISQYSNLSPIILITKLEINTEICDFSLCNTGEENHYYGFISILEIRLIWTETRMRILALNW